MEMTTEEKLKLWEEEAVHGFSVYARNRALELIDLVRKSQRVIQGAKVLAEHYGNLFPEPNDKGNYARDFIIKASWLFDAVENKK
jgi:hypothetical protein